VARVLVVEDDRTVADVLCRYLEREGHQVDRTADGADGLEQACAPDGPDLVVLDLMLPGMDGIEVCRRLREVSDVPVIMLTALGAEAERVHGLQTGADDYVTKPFSVRELVLRVASLLRRAAGQDAAADPVPELLRSAGLLVDVPARCARRDGVDLGLTVRETDLLVHLMRHPGRAFTRQELLAQVWGWDFGDTSTVTVHARRLRHKVELDPAHPALLATVWGVGYRWDAPVDRAPLP
jgi:DNA-binding response OmpR family regulator